LAARVLGGDRTRSALPSPWIEEYVDRSFADSESDNPIFALINLVDAHEPYFPNINIENGSSSIEMLRQRQDFSSLMEGNWSPTEQEYSILRRLYMDAVDQAARRVSNLIRLLQKRGRWENTLFIVTADHGQALGEHGLALHGGPPVEALVRVPLIVRYPRQSASIPHVCSRWASLVDIAPTILRTVGITSQERFDGIALQHLDAADPPRRTVFTYGEGLILWDPGRSLSSPVRRALDREAIAAYGGRFKLVRTLRPPTTRVFDVETDTTETDDLSNRLPSEFEELKEGAGSAVSALEAAKTRPDGGMSVSDRLRLWGYG
jgi:arylsulfatase A-like enzyme